MEMHFRGQIVTQAWQPQQSDLFSKMIMFVNEELTVKVFFCLHDDNAAFFRVEA